MSKLVRGGKVAVLVAAGQGMGWATQSTNPTKTAFALFDPAVVNAVLRESEEAPQGRTLPPNVHAINQRVAERFPTGGFNPAGAAGLIVCWVDQGARFDVISDRGRENLLVNDDGAFEA
jgi:hypothetical protein